MLTLLLAAVAVVVVVVVAVVAATCGPLINICKLAARRAIHLTYNGNKHTHTHTHTYVEHIPCILKETEAGSNCQSTT